MTMKTHGISQSSTSVGTSSELLSDLIKQQPIDFIKSDPDAFDAAATDSIVSSVLEDLMDDNSPVSGDPMMSAPSPAGGEEMETV